MGASASVPEVSAYVKDLNPTYSQYAQAVEEQGIDGTTAMHLSENDLEELGVEQSVHRRRLLAEIQGAEKIAVQHRALLTEIQGGEKTAASKSQSTASISSWAELPDKTATV